MVERTTPSWWAKLLGSCPVNEVVTKISRKNNVLQTREERLTFETPNCSSRVAEYTQLLHERKRDEI
jgi:hypothetical protein